MRIEDVDTRLIGDLSVKIAQDFMRAASLAIQLVPRDQAPTLMAHALQNLVGMYSVYGDMDDSTFDQWLDLMRKTRVKTQEAINEESR